MGIHLQGTEHRHPQDAKGTDSRKAMTLRPLCSGGSNKNHHGPSAHIRTLRAKKRKAHLARNGRGPDLKPARKEAGRQGIAGGSRIAN